MLTAVEDAIASARELIYVEHQYLSAKRVIDALAAALEREPALEIVVVMNQNPDVTAYRGWQNERLRAAKLLDHPRVGVFTLWRGVGDSEKRWRCNQVFVHSKVLLVDDRVAIVGSANLDGVSLHSYGADFTGWLGARVFRRVRNIDVALVCRASTELGAENVVRALRERLWSEHLGLGGDVTVEHPLNGWLSLWRCAAESSRDALCADAPLYGATSSDVSHDGTAQITRAFVLPYSERTTPSGQLTEAGVTNVDNLALCFDPSWLEIHFSPNWVRNMFA